MAVKRQPFLLIGPLAVSSLSHQAPSLMAADTFTCSDALQWHGVVWLFQGPPCRRWILYMDLPARLWRQHSRLQPPVGWGGSTREAARVRPQTRIALTALSSSLLLVMCLSRWWVDFSFKTIVSTMNLPSPLRLVHFLLEMTPFPTGMSQAEICVAQSLYHSGCALGWTLCFKLVNITFLPFNFAYKIKHYI